MRLGGPVFSKYSDPQHWIEALQRYGYSAAYCPIGSSRRSIDVLGFRNNNRASDNATVQSYAEAAEEANVVIAEVGAWSNPLSPNEKTRREAIEKCKSMLALADMIGARCCVNIAGSCRADSFYGPHPDNLTEKTFDLIVETVQTIIDAVNPTRTFYTLETMEWIYPDSVDSYLKLVKAVNRKQFAVHFDPVNLIYSPQLYFKNRDVIKDFIERLGPQIKSCHAKDIILTDKLTVHLDETRPGLGFLNYPVYLLELSKLDANTPLMMEHLSSEEEYSLAADYIRTVAKANWVPIL